MNIDFVENANAEIVQSINKFEYHFEDYSDVKNIIFEFLNLKNHNDIFGMFGNNLKNFLLHADLNHSELLSFLRHKIFSDDCISEIKELFILYKYCKRKKLRAVEQNLFKLCNHFVAEKIFLVGKTIDNLKLTKVHTRFLPDKERWEVRGYKKPTKIQGLKKTFDSDDIQEDQLFVCYHHNSCAVAEVLSDLKIKESMFLKIECTNLANEVNAAIKKIETDLQSQSLGFHRITLNAVARNMSRWYGDKGDADVKIYPIDASWCETNRSINNLVKICEQFPAYDGKFACFDHYGVIKCEHMPFGIIVGERDTQTFFMGYYHE